MRQHSGSRGNGAGRIEGREEGGGAQKREREREGRGGEGRRNNLPWRGNGDEIGENRKPRQETRGNGRRKGRRALPSLGPWSGAGERKASRSLYANTDVREFYIDLPSTHRCPEKWTGTASRPFGQLGLLSSRVTWQASLAVRKGRNK